MRLILALAIMCASTLAKADDQIAVLKDFCDKNQADFWAKNSESCRLVRGEYKLDQLCEGYAKGNTRLLVRMQSIADKYAELKSIESDAALQLLCKAQVGSDAIAAKPECTEEREGRRQIARKWWNGIAWVTTKENPTAIKEKAEKGDRSSQYNLGVWHLDGADCVSRDIKIAAPLLCRAYDSGEKMAGLEFQKINKHPSDFKAREMFGKANGCELTSRLSRPRVTTPLQSQVTTPPLFRSRLMSLLFRGVNLSLGDATLQAVALPSKQNNLGTVKNPVNRRRC